MEFTIEFDQSPMDSELPSFAPGDLIEGAVRWDTENAVEDVQIALLFESKGKGTPQREVFDERTLDHSTLNGEDRFSFTAADWPWSFSGKLISLVWMIRVTAKAPRLESESHLIISPTRFEMDLYAYQPTGETLGKKWLRSQQTAILRSKRRSR